MNRDRALELKKFAETIADRFSNFNRDGNQNKETFSVEDVIPLSDDSAVINFKKSSTLKQSGKLAVAFCYYINRGRDIYYRFFEHWGSKMNVYGWNGRWKNRSKGTGYARSRRED